MIGERLITKWLAALRLQYALKIAAYFFAVAVVMFALNYFMLHWNWMVMVFLLIPILFAFVFFLYPKGLNTFSVANHLDAHYPELQDSSQLVLQPATGLNFLQKLQQSRVNNFLRQIPNPYPFGNQLKQPLVALAIAGFIALALSYLPHVIRQKSVATPNNIQTSAVLKEIIPPQIEDATVRIIPPAYTRKPARSQDRFSFEVEEGGVVEWSIHTKGEVKKMSLVINDKQTVPLKRSGDGQFGGAMRITQNGFYQISLDDELSDVYAMEIIKDEPPTIKVQTPATSTIIGYGQAKRVTVSGFANDDYGMVSSSMFATIATGKGEGVKFRETTIPINSPGGSKVYNFSKLIDLNSLQMEPGDELYFYIEIKDAKGHVVRSEAQTVAIKDTAELMALDGFSTGVNIMPEYFRSQRQIIMDTEKLLKEKGSMSTAEFNERCNNIGIDQKLLRLRYGKFLGEENEEEIGHDDSHEGHDHAEGEQEDESATTFGDPEKLMESVTHMHDRAEDATFFDAKTKTQLRKTLTEMWKSELQLRTFKPQAALPFEYKALELLKELQQQNRVYVAKTKYSPPPFDAGKRLSGDLSGINSPVFRSNTTSRDNTAQLRTSMSAIQNIKAGKTLTQEDLKQIQFASSQIMNRSASVNKEMLAGLRAARNMLNKKVGTQRDINAIGAALQAIVQERQLPEKRAGTKPDNLGQRYLNNLKKF